MLSVRSSRRRRRRSISLVTDDQKLSDQKVTMNEVETAALASHQHRGRRAKSEVNTKRNRVSANEQLEEANTQRRSTNNMLKLPFGSPNRKRSLSEAETLNGNKIKNGENKQQQQRTISEGSSSSNIKEEKRHSDHGKKITWHRRSASTGSPSPQPGNQTNNDKDKQQTNLLLKVPGSENRSSLPRAKSEDRLHELTAEKLERKRRSPEARRCSTTAALEKAEVQLGDPPGQQQQQLEEQHHGRGVAALFARQMLQYSYPLVSPPPIVVEDPPSSDDAGDEKLPSSRRRRNAKLNGSSGSSGSGSSVPGAKSAPPTPHGDRLQAGNSFPTASTPDPPPTTTDLPPPPRSPSHVFTKNEKQALKQLSSSTPTMTAAPSSSGGPEPEVVVNATPPGSSKARQKKFHRHFKQVPAEERVLNYYSCALVSDILLQGHLYITKNYFAFYSNVFGYVTKLLIPTASVLKVSKEKTAKIIPNAVGIATLHEKHVFGSLLSRDATYKLMIQVWKTATEPEAVIEDAIVLPKLEPSESKEEVVSAVSVDAALVDDEDSSLSGSGNDDSAIERSCSPTPIDTPTDAGSLSESKDTTSSIRHKRTTLSHSMPDGPMSKERGSKIVNHEIKVNNTTVPIKTLQSHIRNSYNSVQSMPRPTLILLISTGLLAMLFISAALLLYRISAIQSQFAMHPVISNSGDVYQEILKWQIQLHSKSSNEVQQFLNNNLDQIAKVRQSLEALSLLIVSEEEMRHRHHQPHHHHPPYQSGTPPVDDQQSTRGAS